MEPLLLAAVLVGGSLVMDVGVNTNVRTKSMMISMIWCRKKKLIIWMIST